MPLVLILGIGLDFERFGSSTWLASRDDLF